jgi:hypothetical protein
LIKLLQVLLATLVVACYARADRVRIGVSNYNLSNLTVGVALLSEVQREIGLRK